MGAVRDLHADLGAYRRRFANKAQPKTLNRATGVVLVVLGVVIMGFQLLHK